MGDDLYGGMNWFLIYLKNNQGVVVYYVDIINVDVVKEVIMEKMVMVLLEMLMNLLIKIVDVVLIVRVLYEVNSKVLVVVDNIMLLFMFCNFLDFGVDIFYEFGIKYFFGYYDIMVGVIVVNDVEIGDKMYFIINVIGCGFFFNDFFLFMRGVKILVICMEKQQISV